LKRGFYKSFYCHPKISRYFKLQKILGHKTIQITMRYCHLSPNAFAEDFNRLPHFQENKNAQLIVFPAT
jgi:hypothetical protein